MKSTKFRLMGHREKQHRTSTKNFNCIATQNSTANFHKSKDTQLVRGSPNGQGTLIRRHPVVSMDNCCLVNVNLITNVLGQIQLSRNAGTLMRRFVNRQKKRQNNIVRYKNQSAIADMENLKGA